MSTTHSPLSPRLVDEALQASLGGEWLYIIDAPEGARTIRVISPFSTTSDDRTGNHGEPGEV